MDRQQIAAKLALKALGLDVCLDSFGQRLTIQKAVYLAQAAGVNLGYHYQWYLRGPYSPGLTKDAFAISAAEENDSDETANWSLDPESAKRLADLRGLISLEASTTERARQLELLASVHFLVDKGQVQSGNVSEIHLTLQRFGKSFSQEEIVAALKELANHGLRAAAKSNRH